MWLDHSWDSCRSGATQACPDIDASDEESEETKAHARAKCKPILSLIGCGERLQALLKAPTLRLDDFANLEEAMGSLFKPKYI